MAALAYVNGEFVPEDQARISIFDRGFLFGDGVYEVIPVIERRLIDRDAHKARLARSLAELRMPAPLPLEEIDRLQEQLVMKNAIKEGRVYVQVSRGPAERDFAFPANPQPSLVMFAREVAFVNSPLAERGIRIKTTLDIRWRRRDIKTVMLLASSIAKQEALDAGFDDCWFVEDGFITEGSSNNAYIVKDGRIKTRHLSSDILAGCTRQALLDLAREGDLIVEEAAFTPQEAREAEEAFISSATMLVTPVVQIDDGTIGSGRPGPVATRLRQIYLAHAMAG